MDSSLTPSRRQLMKTLAGIGIGSAVFQRAVVAQAPKGGGRITAEMIEQAEWITGLKLSDDQRKALVRGINSSQRSFNRLRKMPLDERCAARVRVHSFHRAGGRSIAWRR